MTALEKFRGPLAAQYAHVIVSADGGTRKRQPVVKKKKAAVGAGAAAEAEAAPSEPDMDGHDDFVLFALLGPDKKIRIYLVLEKPKQDQLTVWRFLLTAGSDFEIASYDQFFAYPEELLPQIGVRLGDGYSPAKTGLSLETLLAFRAKVKKK